MYDAQAPLQITDQYLQQLHQSIARANFQAERGVRYGQDCYDERMRASRLLIVDERPIENLTDDTSVNALALEKHAVFALKKSTLDAGPDVADKDVDEKTPEDKVVTASPIRDPLRMFGFSVPSSLRTAQSQSVHLVEEIIPQLVTVDATMRMLEIGVRRARKRRAKLATEGSALTSDAVTV